MFFKQERNDLQYAQKKAKSLLIGKKKQKNFALQNISTFFGQLRCSFKLIAEEKEIIFFAVLQWIAILIAYLLWIQVLDWIPDSVWEEVQQSNGRNDDGAFKLMNLVLLGWSLLVITAVAYPISLFSAAMVASHYLRHSDQISTVGKCLQLASRNLQRLWLFSTIDAWITADAILDRLPKRNWGRTGADELLYYTWKIGTVGVLPALVAGKSYIDAAKDSISLLRSQPTQTVGIRMGYSLLCWIIGITAYVGSMYYFSAFGDHTNGANKIYNFYFLMVVPILTAVGITAVLVRPFFLIMTAKLYTDNVPFAKIEIDTKQKNDKGLVSIFVLILCLIIGAIVFGQTLGMVEWIESMAVKDIDEYRV